MVLVGTAGVVTTAIMLLLLALAGTEQAPLLVTTHLTLSLFPGVKV
jgi:hypothetical protein